MAFDSGFLSELKLRNEIEDVIGRYVTLKRNGPRMVGRCPFHSEKTPSFTVFLDTSSFYCFGCGAGGDVITFIMKIENLDYAEAVRFLAERAGMQLPEQSSQSIALQNQRERIYQMHKLAARFYYDTLLSENGKPGLEYLKARGIGKSAITRYGLGFAPDKFDSLKNYLLSKRYSLNEMFAAGLLSKSQKNSSYYDRFRNRVMFPVIDLRSNVIAFSGRIVGDGGPKYLNSPETPIYTKGHTLFGLNLAKDNSDTIILVEGNLDVVSLSQAGFKNAAAPLGTAFTKDQARIIAKYAKTVLIAFDNDAAGQKASEKAIPYLTELGLSVKMLDLKGAKDPDEFIKKYGRERFDMLIKGSKTPVEYKIELLREKYDLGDTAQKMEFLRKAIDIIAQIPSAIEREVYAAKLAGQLEIEPATLKSEVLRRRKAVGRQSLRQSIVKEREQIASVRDSVNKQRAKNLKAAKAEETLIAILFKNPDLFEYITNSITADEFITDFNRDVYSFIVDEYQNYSDLENITFSKNFSAEQCARISHTLNTLDISGNARAQADDCIKVIKDENIKQVKTDDLSPGELLRLIDQKKQGSHLIDKETQK